MTLVNENRSLVGDLPRPRTLMRTLVVGAGVAGQALARDLREASEYGLEPIGFLDDDEVSVDGGCRIPVLGTLDELTEVSQAYQDVVYRFLGEERPHRFIETEKRGFLKRIFG